MSAAADRAPFKYCSQGLYQVRALKKEEEVAQHVKGPSGTSSGRAENLYLKPLKFVLGPPKWKIYTTEGPPPKAADRALSLKSASEDIMSLLEFILTTTYFVFRGQIYQQRFGTAKSRPLLETKKITSSPNRSHRL